MWDRLHGCYVASYVNAPVGAPFKSSGVEVDLGYIKLNGHEHIVNSNVSISVLECTSRDLF